MQIMGKFGILRPWRKNRTARRPLLFMHICKTGGQSLSQYIREQFPEAQVCPHNTDNSLLHFSARELSQYTFFSGHISPIALATRVPEFDTITVLREPSRRLVSAYHYWRKIAIEKWPDLPKVFYDISDMSLSEFLESDKTVRLVDNVQARLMAGGRYGLSNDERSMVFGGDGQPEWDRFKHVGITERLDRTIAALSSIYGWPPTEPPYINKGQAAAAVTGREAELLAKRTQRDIDVYQRAVSQLTECSSLQSHYEISE